MPYNTKSVAMSLYLTALTQFIWIAFASPISLQVSTYKTTKGIKQNSFDDNLITEVNMPPPL